MRVISTTNASSLEFQGETYEPGPDGVFNFPEPVGVELTTKHASMWVAEDTFNAQALAAQRDKLRDPNFMVTVVADLLGRVAALEAKQAPVRVAEPAAPDDETETEQPPAETGEQEASEESSPAVPGETAEDDGSTSEDAEPEVPAEADKPKLTAAQKRAAAKKAAASKPEPEDDPAS